MNKIVGKVTESERDQIRDLFERKNGLVELARILKPDNNDLYEKVIKDLGETQGRFQSWWDKMSQKYNWESSPNGSWTIDFETCDITLTQL